jgi:hypothetical protein
VSFWAADKDGGVATPNQIVLAVDHAQPRATLADAPATALEGTVIQLSASDVSDGPADVAAGFRYAWDVTKVHHDATTPHFASGTAANFAFTPDDDGTYTVTVVAADKDGVSSVAAAARIEVHNVVPTIPARLPVMIAEGTPLTIDLTAADDPSAVDAASLLFSFDLDGDGAYEIVDVTQRTQLTETSASGTYEPPRKTCSAQPDW